MKAWSIALTCAGVVLAGCSSPKGEPGPAGPKGDVGAKGDRGDPGAQGERGPIGPGGVTTPLAILDAGSGCAFGGVEIATPDAGSALVCNGAPGRNGENGQPGAQGVPGTQGTIGPKGDPGDAGAPGPRVVLRDSTGALVGWAISEWSFFVPAAGCALTLNGLQGQPAGWFWGTNDYEVIHFENSNCTGRAFYGAVKANPGCLSSIGTPQTWRYFKWKQPLDWVSFTTHSNIDASGNCVTENNAQFYGELQEVFPPALSGPLTVAAE